ncbi:hypothetical protein ARMGADRAFT_1081976 [Armillaria gallica]|uniref:Uncharacterized protein n=1 Tax=Armillaria gallica TaxID=47427 RepID=A0A2H3DSF1_ARMGA|nr:hypothetical protein ARMGADRAFT_1081976 [Armillaria gallica]
MLSKLEHLPLLVTPAEIKHLWYQLILMQRNESSLLHTGDYSESFDLYTQISLPSLVRSKFNALYIDQS